MPTEGQVQPFWLTTFDNEKLFCWHVLPLDVYLENEHELSTAAAVGQAVEELKGTVGEKLMNRDVDTRIVINFHGVSFCFLFAFPDCSYFHFPSVLLRYSYRTVIRT